MAERGPVSPETVIADVKSAFEAKHPYTIDFDNEHKGEVNPPSSDFNHFYTPAILSKIETAKDYVSKADPTLRMGLLFGQARNILNNEIHPSRMSMEASEALFTPPAAINNGNRGIRKFIPFRKNGK